MAFIDFYNKFAELVRAIEPRFLLLLLIMFFILHYISAYFAAKETAKLTINPNKYFPYILRQRAKNFNPPEIILYNLEEVCNRGPKTNKIPGIMIIITMLLILINSNII